MKKRLAVLSASWLVFCWVPGHAAGAAAQEQTSLAQAVAGRFDEAIACISGGEMEKGVDLLLGIILISGPEESFPEGFKARIEAARADVASGDLSAGIEDMRKALTLWEPAAEAEFKAGSEGESGNRAPLGRIFKDKLTTAEDLLILGEAKAAVTGILQALLLLSPAPKG